jgi:hypothetical protein
MNQTSTYIFKLIMACFLVVGSLSNVSAQCTNNGVFFDDLTPAGVGEVNSGFTSCAYGGEYYTVSVVAGNVYNFNTCGSTYDTQITLFTNTGGYLAYDDDGSVCGSGASDLTWTATITGTVRVQMNQYNCITNQICAPLEVILVSEVAGGCESYIVTSPGPCIDALPSINVTLVVAGNCTMNTVYVSIDGGAYVTLPLNQPLAHSETLSLTGADPYTSYSMYGQLSDGTLTNEMELTTGDCGFAGCEEVTFAINPDCYGDEVSWAVYDQLDQLVYFVGQDVYPNAFGDALYPTTLCLNPGCYTFEIYDSSGDGLSDGTGTCANDGFFFAIDSQNNTLFEGDAVYTTQDTYSFCVGAEPCTFINTTSAFVSCANGFNEYEFVANYVGDCTVASIMTFNSVEGWVELDASTFGFLSGESMYITGLLNNTNYQYYVILSDGTESNTGFFSTGDCNEACGNANLEVVTGECLTVNGVSYATANLYFEYIGSCGVSSIYYSTDGGVNFEILDISADGVVNGSVQEYYFTPGATYYLFYMLENGEQSDVVVYTAEDCLSGETICDCDGTQLPIEATAWLGDGSLDDGTFLWNNELPVNFNCQLWGFDCDDAGVGVSLDPFGVCYGNLPPGNGCVDQICNGVVVEVAIDCYAEETAVQIINESGEIVYSFDETFFVDPNSMVTQPMCLPTGCYTFVITDIFGDGLGSVECATPGYFVVYDETGDLVTGGGDFGSIYSQEFCVGGDACSNLTLDINAEACVDYENSTLSPSVSLDINYDGDCSVAAIYIAVDGGEYQPFEYAEGELVSGSNTQFYNFTANTSYSFFYVLTDGSVSSVESFITGDCNNEISICDCAGTSHSIGVLAWLSDGFADNGAYDWVGQPVDFNCATWGYDCGDVVGAPSIDVYGVCSGNLPPNNGCIDENEVLGCTDPAALNYNPAATVNNGSCVYNAQFGCLDENACNFSSTAIYDNGSCEYLTCAGCTDPGATNYDSSATIDDGSCNYDAIAGCTDADALNYNPTATEDDGSCVYTCDWPSVTYTAHCNTADLENYFVTMSITDLGNGSPYIVTNSYSQAQYTVNFLGTIEVGPFPNDQEVVITVVSAAVTSCFITSPVLSSDCSNPDSVSETISTDTMVSVYPNPTTGRLNIYSATVSGMVQIRMFDHTGKLIESTQMNIATGATNTFDVSKFAAGTYHLEVISNDRVQHESIIIQK